MIHFGIIGAGDIARKFADAVRQLDNAEVIAVASKSLDRAQEWAAREHIPSYYGNYAELLANPRIDAVYIATTTNAHYDNILQCLQAGKHVLCEKSLVRSAHEALTVCSLAKQKNLFLMEAMWTRFLPKTITAKQWIQEGRIGKVKLMQATFIVKRVGYSCRRKSGHFTDLSDTRFHLVPSFVFIIIRVLQKHKCFI